MDGILSAINSTEVVNISERITAVCQAITYLKENNGENEVLAFLETPEFESKFEKLVAIKLIDSFKLKDNLISNFSKGDLWVISQSLKCDWFFEDEGDLLVDKNLILTFFSSLSYSTRCKVIRKYSKKLKVTDRAENLFLVLGEIYSITTAMDLLPACSEPFVKDIIYTKPVVLSSYVIENLYKKFPDLSIEYIFSFCEKRVKNKMDGRFNFAYSNTLIKIASDKPSLFIEFWEKYSSLITLRNFSRCVTCKIVKVGYSSVLKNVRSYMDIFTLKNIVSALSLDQIEELHFELLPKTLNELFSFNCCCYYGQDYLELIDYVKNPFAEELFKRSFERKYGKNPLDLTLTNENIYLLKYFPEDIRTEWAEKKLSDHSYEESEKASILAYLPFERAFDALKDLMSTTLSVKNTRINIVENMIKSARIYKDVPSACEIVKYIVERHRNDFPQVKGAVLDELIKDFDLLKLSTEEWKPIVELINILIINNDTGSYSYAIIHIYEKLIHHRLTNNLPVDSELEILMKHIFFYYEYNISPNIEYEAYCLNWCNEYLEKKSYEDDDIKERYAIQFFTKINHFNFKNPQFMIEHRSWVMNIIKDRLRKPCMDVEIMESLKEARSLKISLFNELFPEAIIPQHLLYKLKYNISDIDNNVKEILCKIMNSSNVELYKTFFQRLLFYPELSNKYIEHCLNEIKSDDEESSTNIKENGIIILSYLGNTNVFLSFVQDYFPSSSKADSEGNDAYGKYRLQSAICRSLKNVNPPFEAIKAVQQFTQGDYLKLVLGSMLSVSLKISQTRAIAFLKKYMDTPVSCRKHFIRAMTLVSPKNDVNTLLMSLINNENNNSIRALLFFNVFALMKRDPCEMSWETVKQSLSCMTENDLKVIHKKVFNPLIMPLEYLTEYIKLVWETLDSINASEDAKNHIFSLINETTMSLLSDEFADILLSLTYYGKWDRHASAWATYISLYLNCCKSKSLEKRLSDFFEFIKDKFAGSGEEELDSLVEFSSLIETISQKSISDEFRDSSVSSQIISDLQDNILKVFPEYKIINVSLKLSLCKLFLKNTPKNITVFADDVCSLIDTMCSKYGPESVHLFSSIVKDFVSNNFSSKNENGLLIFSHQMITGSASPLNKLVGVLLLPDPADLGSGAETKMYKLALDSIKTSSDLCLKMYARHTIYNI